MKRTRANATAAVRAAPFPAAVALLLAAACLAPGAAGCAPAPLWPKKIDVGGRCPYYKELPRFDLTYTWGDGADRTTLRLGWLGAIVEYAATGPLRPAHAVPRCLDRATLAEVYGRTVEVVPRVDDTFAPEGAAVLDAGWSEWIEFTDEGKTRNVAWLSKGTGKEWGLPPRLKELLAYYAWFARVLGSREGSPPLDERARRGPHVPPERTPSLYDAEPGPPRPEPGPPTPAPTPPPGRAP